MEILQGILLVSIVILAFVLIYEAAKYKEYILAKNALMSMGMGMQKGFDTVVENLNRLTAENIELKQDSALTDQELVVIRQILDMHGEKIEMKQMMKMFEYVDKLKAKED